MATTTPGPPPAIGFSERSRLKLLARCPVGDKPALNDRSSGTRPSFDPNDRASRAKSKKPRYRSIPQDKPYYHRPANRNHQDMED